MVLPPQESPPRNQSHYQYQNQTQARPMVMLLLNCYTKLISSTPRGEAMLPLHHWSWTLMRLRRAVLPLRHRFRRRSR